MKPVSIFMVVDLAGAVGAEEAEDLALVEAEGDIVHRGEAAEPLGQARDLDQCRHASPPSPAGAGGGV